MFYSIFFVSVHLPYLKWVSVRVCVCVCVCVRVPVYCIFWKKGAQLAYMCREKSKHFFYDFLARVNKRINKARSKYKKGSIMHSISFCSLCICFFLLAFSVYLVHLLAREIHFAFTVLAHFVVVVVVVADCSMYFTFSHLNSVFTPTVKQLRKTMCRLELFRRFVFFRNKKFFVLILHTISICAL